MSPLDYTLYCQTVTLYRLHDGNVQRQVAQNCYLQREDRSPTEIYGKSRRKDCLLIIPGDALQPQPGDRVYAGIGPEQILWEQFLPALVPEVYELSYARPCCWEGSVTHWEAGSRKEA